MTDRIERELTIDTDPENLWQLITGDGWLADEVRLELTPGGDAEFRSGDEIRAGWVEDVLPGRRLTFWWGTGDEPATRVELTLAPQPSGTLLRVVETRPLELLDLVGTPMQWGGGRSYGPALVAA